jgi:WXG100 family type VII secretion target
MAGFKATPEQLMTAATSCDSTAADVEAALGQLKAYVVQTEDWWHGIASDTFQELMQTYHTNSLQLHQALTEIAVRLRRSAANYSGGEQANVKSVTGILQSLPAANLG